MDKIEVLKRADIFRELDDEQLRIVADLCNAEVFEVGEIIHRQNMNTDKLRIIEEGLIAIVLELGPLSQRQVTAATTFETIGWSAVIPPYMASASAKAIEKTKVLAFDGHDLINLCETNSQIGCIIYRGIAMVVADRLHAAFMQCVGVVPDDLHRADIRYHSTR